jgi:hypothetical protein
MSPSAMMSILAYSMSPIASRVASFLRPFELRLIQGDTDKEPTPRDELVPTRIY